MIGMLSILITVLLIGWMTTEITYSDSRSWTLMTAATIVSLLLFFLWLVKIFSKWRFVLFNVRHVLFITLSMYYFSFS